VGEGLLSSPEALRSPGYFYLEDGDAAIWVSIDGAREKTLWEGTATDLGEIRAGREIEIEGVLSREGYAVRILPRRLRILGDRELAPAREADLHQLFSGGIRAKRVRVSGVVQDITDAKNKRDWIIKVETGLGHFLTWLPKTEAFSPGHLLDSKVEITGAVVVLSTWRKEFFAPRIMPGRAEDIVVIAGPPADPFSVPRLPLDQLDSFVPGGRPLHRRSVEGTVTYIGDSFLVLQEDSCAIRVNLSANNAVIPALGDRILAAGFIDRSRAVADLSGAVVRKIGTGTLPAPSPVTMTEIRSEVTRLRLGKEASLPAGYEGLLVEITGTLLDVQQNQNGPDLLEVDCGDSLTTVSLPGSAKDLRIGSVLRVKGIAELQYQRSLQTSTPIRLDLRLRDRSDIGVLKMPSWWTAERTRSAAIAVFALAGVATALAVILGRIVKKRTRQLAQEIRGRRDAAIEFEAALQERSRLAANLHDTVLQTVTGLGLQIKACGLRAAQLADPALVEPLQMAWKIAQRSQEDLRNAVWALNALPVKEESITEAVRTVARQVSEGHPVRIHVEAIEPVPVVADFVTGNLLLVIQEAIHNAIKHGTPTEIRILIEASNQGTRLGISIQDNGLGFVVGAQPGTKTGHFGVHGMSARVKRLAGTFQLESQPGKGTCIRVEVPIHSFDNDLA
jgi:signal transduction histidine kinase